MKSKTIFSDCTRYDGVSCSLSQVRMFVVEVGEVLDGSHKWESIHPVIAVVSAIRNWFTKASSEDGSPPAEFIETAELVENRWNFEEHAIATDLLIIDPESGMPTTVSEYRSEFKYMVDSVVALETVVCHWPYDEGKDYVEIQKKIKMLKEQVRNLRERRLAKQNQSAVHG